MSIKYSTFRKIKETFTGYEEQVGYDGERECISVFAIQGRDKKRVITNGENIGLVFKFAAENLTNGTYRIYFDVPEFMRSAV